MSSESSDNSVMGLVALARRTEDHLKQVSELADLERLLLDLAFGVTRQSPGYQEAQETALSVIPEYLPAYDDAFERHWNSRSEVGRQAAYDAGLAILAEEHLDSWQRFDLLYGPWEAMVKFIGVLREIWIVVAVE